MKITEVHIHLIKPKNGLIGFASLVVDNNIYLSSIAIHQKLDLTGYRLTYPTKDQFTIFHPINIDTSKMIEEIIFKKLKLVINKIVNHEEKVQL